MSKYMKEIENIAVRFTKNQADGYAQILRLCDAAKNETDSLAEFRLNHKTEAYSVDMMAAYNDYRRKVKTRAKEIMKLFAERKTGITFCYEAGDWKPVYTEYPFAFGEYDVWLRFYEIHSEAERDNYDFNDMTLVPLRDLPEGTALEYVAEISLHKGDGTLVGRYDIPLSVFVGSPWEQYLTSLLDDETGEREDKTNKVTDHKEYLHLQIYDIQWETSDEDAEPDEEAPDLPQEITVTDRFCVNDYLLSDGSIDQDALGDDVADWLSNEYGFLHGGYRMRIALPKTK